MRPTLFCVLIPSDEALSPPEALLLEVIDPLCQPFLIDFVEILTMTFNDITFHIVLLNPPVDFIDGVLVSLLLELICKVQNGSLLCKGPSRFVASRDEEGENEKEKANIVEELVIA
jgi:hypothetical protein